MFRGFSGCSTCAPAHDCTRSSANGSTKRTSNGSTSDDTSHSTRGSADGHPGNVVPHVA